jgi:hypothetical protein
MDVSDASYYIQENNENKGSRMGQTKKKKKIKKKKKKPSLKYAGLLIRRPTGPAACPSLSQPPGPLSFQIKKSLLLRLIFVWTNPFIHKIVDLCTNSDDTDTKWHFVTLNGVQRQLL